MTTASLIRKLRDLPNKRRFCSEHKLPARTLWRLVSGLGNPTASTVEAFTAALAKDARRRK